MTDLRESHDDHNDLDTAWLAYYATYGVAFGVLGHVLHSYNASFLVWIAFAIAIAIVLVPIVSKVFHVLGYTRHTQKPIVELLIMVGVSLVTRVVLDGLFG